jgi:hypothetical protein
MGQSQGMGTSYPPSRVSFTSKKSWISPDLGSSLAKHVQKIQGIASKKRIGGDHTMEIFSPKKKIGMSPTHGKQQIIWI